MNIVSCHQRLRCSKYSFQRFFFKILSCIQCVIQLLYSWECKRSAKFKISKCM